MNPLGATVVVTGVGARTPVGLTAVATAAAVRAGIAALENHPFMIDTAGKPMIVTMAPYLNDDVSGEDRLTTLAIPAALEALAPLKSSKPTLPVFLGLPPARPGRGTDLEIAVVTQLKIALGEVCRVAKVETFETGHAAGAMAMKAAWEAVRSGTVEFALAGGVDSYMEPETLEWLEENDQIHSAGAENNPYGFVPGEAAGFVLLASAVAAERNRLPTALELLTVATTKETKLIKTDAVCLGEGLTALFRAFNDGLLPGTKVDHLYCDMNGEPYRADEFGFATMKVGSLFRDPSAFTTPADCWGDVGAASAPLFLVLADGATRKGYARGTIASGFTSSESGERCGFVARAKAPPGVR